MELKIRLYQPFVFDQDLARDDWEAYLEPQKLGFYYDVESAIKGAIKEEIEDLDLEYPIYYGIDDFMKVDESEDMIKYVSKSFGGSPDVSLSICILIHDIIISTDRFYIRKV